MAQTIPFRCPNCKETYDVEDAQPDELIQCPECGTEMRRLKSASKSSSKEDNWQNVITCYAFGMLFLIVGIIIAYFGSGKKGASYAARGTIIGLAIYTGLYLIASTLKP